MMIKTKEQKNYLFIKEKYNPMTDQEYIHLKRKQKKRSRKLKKRNRNWYMEENGIKERKDEKYIDSK